MNDIHQADNNTSNPGQQISKEAAEAEKEKCAEALVIAALAISNEKRFRALIEASPDMETLSTIDGKLIYGSPSVTRVLGYAKEEFLNVSALAFIHETDIGHYAESRLSIIAVPGASFFFQQRCLHKNGSWIWCEGTVTNMLEEPDVNAMVSNFRDISEKKEIEQQQDFDRYNLNALINNTDDLMWSIDREFRLITSNDSFNELTRLLSGNSIEKGDHVLVMGFSEEQVSLYNRFYERAFNGETFTEIQYTAPPHEIWSEISFYPIRKDNEIIGTACYSRNITGRKKSEEQLRQSEAFNRGVLDSLTSHIAVIGHSGDIVAINESWARFALENEETSLAHTGIGSNYLAVCKASAEAGDQTASAILTGIQEVLDEKRSVFYYEYRCPSRHAERWFSMRVMKFESEERMAVISHQEITGRKTAELERTRITVDLIQRNKQHEQFTYIVSHNLRAPVANILGATYALQEYALDEEDRQLLNTGIHESVTRLDDIVKDLSYILQVKDGIKGAMEKVRFSGLIDDIGISIKNLIDSDDIRISRDFSEIDELLTVKSYLYSIFFNLISNSIKYRRPGIPAMIAIHSSRTGDTVTLVFKDNGLGIDLQKRKDQVFGLYKRFHPAIEGKGMGLFMVKTQVESLGGTIHMESTVNQGTEIEIQFKI